MKKVLLLLTLLALASCSSKPKPLALGARLRATAPGTVAFVATDTTTLGNWTGKYGSSASAIPLGPANIPAGITISEGNASTWAWASSTNDPRGLTTPTARIGSAWYNTSFTATVAFADGSTHQVALYLADWDSMGRRETITAGADTRTVASFVAGEYLVYNVTGGATFTLAANAGPNAVVNGIFIDPASGVVVNPPPPPPPPPGNNTVTVVNPSPGTYTLSTTGTPGQHVTATISNASGVVPASGPFVTTVTVAFGHIVSLTWTAPTTSGVTESFKVYKASVSGGPYTLVGPAPAANYQDGAGIASGQTWFYVVTAVTSGGESGYSNEVKAIIP